MGEDLHEYKLSQASTRHGQRSCPSKKRLMGGTEPASFEATILSRTTTTLFSPLKISENSLEFGSQEVGTTSESRTIILVSAGEGAVEIATVAISDSQLGTS